MQRWVRQIFASNNIIDFSYHKCLTASTSETNKINIIADIIFNFFRFYSKGITEYAPYEIEFNRTCQWFNLICTDDIIHFCCKDIYSFGEQYLA